MVSRERYCLAYSHNYISSVVHSIVFANVNVQTNAQCEHMKSRIKFVFVFMMQYRACSQSYK